MSLYILNFIPEKVPSVFSCKKERGKKIKPLQPLMPASEPRFSWKARGSAPELHSSREMETVGENPISLIPAPVPGYSF